jgi:hypothetical protein
MTDRMNFAIFYIPGIGSNSIVCGLNAVCFVCLLWGVIYAFCVSIYFVDHDEEEYNEYWGKVIIYTSMSLYLTPSPGGKWME